MSKCDECKCEISCARKKEVREKIMVCSREGDMDGLYLAIKEHPQVLQDIQDTAFVSTPLHMAAEYGQKAMAIEIRNLMPSFGKKLNPEGLTPLHVAIDSGYTEIAAALALIDKQLVLTQGKGGQTPLHHAATVPRTPLHHTATVPWIDGGPHRRLDELLVDLLLACPQSIDVLNNQSQTVIHVAAENGRFKAVSILKKWLGTRQTESLLTLKDINGDTALHIAVKNPKCPKDLVKSMMKVVVINRPNKDNKTPLDVASTTELKKVLKNGGGRNGEHIGKKLSVFDFLREKRSNIVSDFLVGSYYLMTKELTMEMRNTVLVIAALIATATYQGVLQPPGGVYSAEGNATAIAIGRLLAESQAAAGTPPSGQMVMMGPSYNYFMPTNTTAFILSIVIIMFVLPARYFNVYVHFTLIFMCVSYLLALRFISESNGVSDIMFLLSSCTIGAAFAGKMGYYLVRAFYDGDVWWIRNLGVMVTNWSDGFLFLDEITDIIDSDKDNIHYVPVITRMKLRFKIIMRN